MLRIDEEQTEGQQDKKELQKQERSAQTEQALATKNTSSLDDDDGPDNFAALKAQAWGRMVPGQISQHLSELREQAEQLRLPEKASPPKDARILHYHCDHLGTPRELTDEEGKLVWSAEYLTWGKLKRLQGRAGGSADAADAGVPPDQFWHTRTQPGRANHLPEWVADNTGNVQKWRKAQEAEQSEISQAANDPTVWGELTDQSIRFQGQWHDVETGLHYNRFRYYDPEIGRFIHQDPIGLLGGVNLYQYAPNPLDWTDPLGWWKGQPRNNGRFGHGKDPSKPPKPENIGHGNRKDNPNCTTLYKLVNPDGTVSKWGITSEANPRDRYRRTELGGRVMVPVASGSRVDMLALERAITSRFGGAENLEDWANKINNSTSPEAIMLAFKAARRGCVNIL